MPRTSARVTQADIARAIRAAQQVGAPMAVDIMPDGTIRLFPISAPIQSQAVGNGDNRRSLVDVRERPVL